MEPHEVKNGLPVVRVADRGRQGTLSGAVRNMGTAMYAEVIWGGGPRRFEDIEFLEAIRVGDEGDPLLALIRQRRFGRIEDARLCMTFQKLQGTLTDVFYSMAAAHLRFFPHQFKPVLRFVDSPFNRILVADEVGLGKTIEAGLIWLECQARFDARRLLVVCPNSLRDKWETELKEKFSLPARQEDAAGLLHHHAEYRRQGAGYAFCAICNYQKLLPPRADREILSRAFERDELGSVLEAQMSSNAGKLLVRIASGTEGKSFADLVVFDEAHVMRNTATATHLSGSILSEYSDAVVCLSATPIHNQARDLWSLLRMVEPDTFSSETMFNVMRELNAPVVALQNRLTDPQSTPADIRLAVESLAAAKHGLLQSEILTRLEGMGSTFDGSREAAAEMFNLAERLNLLGAFLCRTRKVQVEKEGRIQRRTKTMKVCLTHEERRLYAAVLQFIRRKAKRQGGRISSFHLISPAMRMASSLPVLFDLIRRRDWGGIQDTYEGEGESAESDAIAPWLGETDLSQLHADVQSLSGYDFEAHDSKYAALCAGLSEIVDHEKVIVFAFFKDTLKYLTRRLRSEGYRVMLLTGDVKEVSQRTALIEEFENGPAQILLSSEVAAEGVDLQFCRTIVNYDLPWNPMRVEQRIGRVDRIGQRSDFIRIINFHVPGTIDGHIYTHLFEKLKIFESTIGDMESIIGDAIEDLAKELLIQELTEEAVIQKIESAHLALSMTRLTERQLEESNANLVAHRDYLAEQVGESLRLGRYVQHEEIKQYLTIFFGRAPRGCTLDWDTPAPQCGRVTLSSPVYRDLLAFMDRSGIATLKGVSQEMVFALTPEALTEHRRRWRQLFLMNHFHPLIRWVTSSMQVAADELHPLSSIEYGMNDISEGDYAYLVRKVELKGLHAREHLVYGLLEVARGEYITGEMAENALNRALRHGISVPVGYEVPIQEGHLEDLRRRIDDRCGRLREDYRGEMQIKANARRAQVAAHFDRKIAATRRRIETMRDSQASRQRGIELASRQLASLERNRNERMAEIAAADRVEMTFAEVTCGHLRVLEGKG